VQEEGEDLLEELRGIRFGFLVKVKNSNLDTRGAITSPTN
jgi:hypothetical protein